MLTRVLPDILIGMAPPLRLEFPGAIYHLTARGDRREDIFADDADRERLLQVFAECVARYRSASSGQRQTGSPLSER